jgi:hypothetical protein
MGISPDSIRRVSEADLLELARAARTTWQNWVRSGLVETSHDGLYDENAVVELVVVTTLLGALDLRQAVGAWRPAKDRVVSQAVALPLEGDVVFLAVIDLHTWQMATATDLETLGHAVRRQAPVPRGRVVFDLGPSVTESRLAYWARASPATELLADGRRRRRSSVAPSSRKRSKP